VHSYSVCTPKTNILFDYIYKIICEPFIDSLSNSSSTIHRGLWALLAGHRELALGQGGEALWLDKALFDNSPILTSVRREVLSISNGGEWVVVVCRAHVRDRRVQEQLHLLCPEDEVLHHLPDQNLARLGRLLRGGTQGSVWAVVHGNEKVCICMVVLT
jgi:hypothetical protein